MLWRTGAAPDRVWPAACGVTERTTAHDRDTVEVRMDTITCPRCERWAEKARAIAV